MSDDKLKHEAFRQPADVSAKVWRYMDLPKVLSLLQRKELHFSRLLEQQDKYEGMDPPGYYEAAFLQLIEVDMRPDQAMAGVDGVIEHQRKAAAGMFINCWHMGNDESEAMWRLYCPDNYGVAVQTTYSRLVASIAWNPYCYVGLVTYIDPRAQTFSAGNVFHRAMHKRASFKHESEVRLVLMHSEHLGGGKAPPIFMSLPWDVEAQADRIFVDPYAPEWFYAVVRDVVGRYSPALVPRIEWSAMK